MNCGENQFEKIEFFEKSRHCVQWGEPLAGELKKRSFLSSRAGRWWIRGLLFVLLWWLCSVICFT